MTRGPGSRSNVPPDVPSMSPKIILEITRIGKSQKISAVDEESGVEVSFIAPVSASRIDIERLARAKLAYVLRKKTGES